VLTATGGAAAVFCDNSTNLTRCYGVEGTTPYPKDGINDHVVSGSPTVNPERCGTRSAAARRHR